MNDLKKKTASGFAYKFAERVGAKGISFVVSILLARILMPEDYGIIALVTVFITLLDVFVTYGFGNSLIVDKNSDQIDFSTCFYFGLLLSIIIYIAVFSLSPSIATWLSVDSSSGNYKYDVDQLVLVLRIMSLRLPIAAMNSVQHAYVAKNMMFKKFFYATLIGTLISGVVAVIMAYQGFGVWALVEQYLGNVIIDTICLAIIVGWRPTLQFSFKRLKKIYAYGWKILVVGLLDTGYSQLRSLVIAKNYSTADLAYYNKGLLFPTTAMGLVEPTVSSVLFPALSQCNDDQKQMRDITRQVIKISSYIIFPLMIMLAASSSTFIEVLLTDKWLDCVIYLQIGCAALLLRPLQFINNCVIRANGKSGLLLILDIVKKGIGIILLIICMPFGVKWIAISLLITNVISTVINIIPNRTILSYGIRTQLKDVGLYLVLAIVMGVPVYLVTFLPLKPFIMLIIQIIVAFALYWGMSAFFKIDSYLMIRRLLNRMIKKGNVDANSVESARK